MVNLDEEDINAIEKFIREEGLDHVTKLLQKKSQCQDDVLLDESQLIDYFGEIYASDPSNFRFVIGDKKLITLVRDHLVKNQNEKGAKYMRRFRKEPNRENKIVRTQQNGLDVINNTDIDNTNDALSTELSASLFEKLKAFMKSFGIDDSIIQSVTQNSVSVKILDGNVAAEVFCALCKNDTTKKRKMNGKKVFYKNGENSKYWVLSNFKEHLKSVHKIKCNQSIENNDAFDNHSNDFNDAENMFLLDDSNAACTTNKPIKKKKNQNKSTAQEQNIEEMALAHNFSIEYVDVEVISPNTQESNTQSIGQNELIFGQINQQLSKMLQATLSNNDTTEEMEFELIENDLQSAKVAKIHPNGACTFGAIVHQLMGYKICSDEHTRAVKKLRTDVVHYISSNYSSIRSELRDRVYAEINPKLITDIDKECKILLRNFFPLEYYWGRNFESNMGNV